MQEESKKKKAVKKISEISVDSRLWDDKVWRVEGGERRKEKWKEEARKGTIKKHSTGFFESEEIELERFRRKRRPCAERILEIAWTTTTWSKTSLLFLVKPNVENVLLIDHRAVLGSRAGVGSNIDNKLRPHSSSSFRSHKVHLHTHYNIGPPFRPPLRYIKA